MTKLQKATRVYTLVAFCNFLVNVLRIEGNDYYDSAHCLSSINVAGEFIGDFIHSIGDSLSFIDN